LFSKFRPKTNLPNYGMFDDKRYFTSSADEIFERGGSTETASEYFTPVEMLIAGVKTKVGIAICEDMWDADYPLKPVKALKQNGADIVVNISASPFGLGK
jgi:NAD+ synthase (glutamine-hydrolysing)